MASGLFEKKQASGVWWRDHSLSLVIAGVLLIVLLSKWLREIGSAEDNGD